MQTLEHLVDVVLAVEWSQNVQQSAIVDGLDVLEDETIYIALPE